MQKKTKYSISVPVYSYAKKVLEKHFEQQKNNLEYDFFVAVGNLLAPIFQISKTTTNLPITSNNISPIELLEITVQLPKYTILLLSPYRKEDIAHSLATVLNKQAKEILRAVVEFNFKAEKTKTKTCQEVFAYYDISEDDLNFRKYVESFYKTKN